jgi:putative spermidine/putrescine transport system permease protein
MRGPRSVSLLDRVGGVVGATVIGLGVFVLLAPIIVTVALSFGETVTFPPTSLTLRWYQNFLGDEDFIDGLRVSVVLALATVATSTLVGTATALALTRHRFPGRAILNFGFLSPILLPKAAIGVSVFLFFIAVGARSAPARLLVAHTLLATPYVIAVVTASIHGIDRSLEQASMNLGASPWQTFRRVTLPLIRPGIVTGAIIGFITSFDEVTASVFLIDVHTKTFPVVLFSYLSRGAIDGTIAAASSFMLLFVMVIVSVLAWYVGLARALGVIRQP